MRKEHPIDQLDARSTYKLLTSVVIPRPIAWISTRSSDGRDNLAPHSFFTIASQTPPIVQFTSIGEKHSLTNIRETGEFVVCLSPRSLLREVNATGTSYPDEISEFDAAGLQREPSLLVAPPRVAGSPVAIECRLHSTAEFPGSTVVFGEVVQIAVDTAVLADDGLPDPRLLDPLSRLGRNEWGLFGEVTELDRVPYTE